jgi:hypothetical protein
LSIVEVEAQCTSPDNLFPIKEDDTFPFPSSQVL